MILLVAFGSIVAAGLPLATALIGLGIGSAAIAVLAGATQVSSVAPTLATMVGLGVGIDYALFVLTRHREGLRAGRSVPTQLRTPPRPPARRCSSPVPR